MFDPYRIPGSRSLHSARLPTWALLIGETYSSAVHAEIRRRPHRGMLPDVDFSRAVPDPSRPSLVRRIIRLIRPGAKIRLVDAAPSGSSNEPVGEKPATPYIARSRADGPDDSGPSALGADAARGLRDVAKPRKRKTDLYRHDRCCCSAGLKKGSIRSRQRNRSSRRRRWSPSACIIRAAPGPIILVDAVLVTAIAIAEVWMFGFLGSIVDWLSAQNRETFLQTEGWKLAGMAVHRAVRAAAASSGCIRCVIHQTLMGNYPQRIRWMVHRYLLRQSMTFFQDEFAGRIATKLMQTALAVRECVMKLLDVLNYVVVYFLGMLVIVGSADWRLALPFVVWLVGYVVLLRYFIPRLGKVAEQQADARSMMTGRIVDSYTNISTVKLFSHSSREESYRQGRRWTSSSTRSTGRCGW